MVTGVDKPWLPAVVTSVLEPMVVEEAMAMQTSTRVTPVAVTVSVTTMSMPSSLIRPLVTVRFAVPLEGGIPIVLVVSRGRSGSVVVGPKLSGSNVGSAGLSATLVVTTCGSDVSVTSIRRAGPGEVAGVSERGGALDGVSLCATSLLVGSASGFAPGSSGWISFVMVNSWLLGSVQWATNSTFGNWLVPAVRADTAVKMTLCAAGAELSGSSTVQPVGAVTTVVRTASTGFSMPAPPMFSTSFSTVYVWSVLTVMVSGPVTSSVTMATSEGSGQSWLKAKPPFWTLRMVRGVPGEGGALMAIGLGMVPTMLRKEYPVPVPTLLTSTRRRTPSPASWDVGPAIVEKSAIPSPSCPSVSGSGKVGEGLSNPESTKPPLNPESGSEAIIILRFSPAPPPPSTPMISIKLAS